MGEKQIIDFFMANFGKIGTILGAVVFLAIRFLPSWLQTLRERRLAALQEKLSERQEYSTRERELFSRLDRKDATLEKITTNHIAHLELQMAQSKEFYLEAVKNLTALNLTQLAMQQELADLRVKTSEIKDDTSFLKGRVS